MKKLLYATTNPGKLFEVGEFLATQGVTLSSPQDFGIDADVDETGKSLEENALIKARAFAAALGNNNEVVVMADDTGVEITALGGEPGIHTRRWKGHKMSDEEIISYCLERMKDVPQGKRDAQFRTVIALVDKSTGEEAVFSGALKGEITPEAAPLEIPGFPFETIFYINEYNILLGDLHKLPPEEKKDIHTHRVRAVHNALPKIKELLEK